MTLTKNILKKSLAVFLAMLMTLGLLTNQVDAALGGSGGSNISVKDYKYTINRERVADTGESLGTMPSAQVTGTNTVYTYTPDAVSGYVYEGYYLKDSGSTAIQTGNPRLTTKKADATNGVGEYTLVAVYSLDDNGNEIPDKTEKYNITERYVDESGAEIATLRNSVVNGVHYEGTPKTVTSYECIGWYYTATNGGYAGGSLTNPLSLDSGLAKLMLNSDTGRNDYAITFVYESTLSPITVKYNRNTTNALATGSIPDQDAYKNIAFDLTLIPTNFKNSGFRFMGWATTPTGAVRYTDGQNVTLQNDTELYAVWEADDSQYSYITFDKNTTDVVTGTMADQKILTGYPDNLNINRFIYAGYDFVEWNTQPDGSGTSYANQASITVSQDITLYAIWAKDATKWATVTYEANTGASVTPVTYEVLKGSNHTLIANPFTYDNAHLFLGWSTQPTGGVEYSVGEVITPTADVTLYAVWGTPDLWEEDIVSDRPEALIGESVHFSYRIGNHATVNSTTLYETEIEMDLEGLFDAPYNLTIKKNGRVINVDSYFDSGVQYITIGDIKPGEVIEVSFDAVALVNNDGGQQFEYNYLGKLNPTTRRAMSAFSTNVETLGGSGHSNITVR
ncbi:MAG: InlB B-repeat-containing protein [Coprobacillaceae bacterium]